MNFLSHFYFAGGELKNPLYTLGLIYPDINRKWKKERKEIYGHSSDLKKGIEEHIRIDNFMNKMPWLEVKTREFMDEYESDTKFRYFCFEWATEIAIDYHISKKIVDDSFYKKIYCSLESRDCRDFLKGRKEDKERIDFIIDNSLLESYSTIQGGREALFRTYNSVIRRYKDYDNVVIEKRKPIYSIFDFVFEKVKEDWDMLDTTLEYGIRLRN